MPSRRDLLKYAAAGATAAWLPRRAQAADRPPNIVFILADDVGWGDLSCYGATHIKTPNLDRLASGGMRFTDAHCPAAYCSATRYGLLTGRYAWRDGVNAVLPPLAPLSVDPKRGNLLTPLKAAGYATGIVGKWHLGLGDPAPDFNGDLKPGPLELGFDSFFGYPTTNDRVPCVFVQDHRVVGLDPQDPLKFMKEADNGGEPTYHTPGIQVKAKPTAGHDGTVINGIPRIGLMSGGQRARFVDEDLADTFVAKATGFIAQHKAHPFFLYYAAHEAHAPICPHPRFRGTSKAGLWGDSVQELDWVVGQLLGALDAQGLTDNTLVIFTSDNGPHFEDGYADPEAVASGHKPAGPWRGGKGALTEGGHREPFIARWPGHVPAGKVSSSLLGLNDMTATFAELVGRPAPAEALDSVSVLPALLNEQPAGPGRDHLIFANGPQQMAVRRGQWKFIQVGARARGPQLYDLAADPGEERNVADEHPELVAKFRELVATEKARK